MNNFQFELNKIISLEANEIISARNRAFAIHRSSDIDAAGDEIEIRVRNLIKSKLPLDYYVGHGHVVDEKLNSNGQHDIIIADNSGSPVLFTAENGTQYFPYESVYGFGEIKSTYYKSKKPIETFVNRTKKIYTELKRKETPLNQISRDVTFSGEQFTFGEKGGRPHQSSLFKFMFFVDSGDFKMEQISQLYKEVNNKFLPNVVIMLDKGIIVNNKFMKNSAGENQVISINHYPEFTKLDELDQHMWLMLQLGTGDPGSYLAYLYFTLNSHLRKCLLLRPDIHTYFNNVDLFTISGGDYVC